MTRTTILVSTMPCEVGAGALYHCLDEKADILIMKIPDARRFEVCMANLSGVDGKNPHPDLIVMVGTYWMDCLEQLVYHFSETLFHIYCPGKVFDYKLNGRHRVTMTSGENNLGPSRFLFELAKSSCSSETLFKLFEKNFSTVMTFIDDRFANRNIADNQAFYTGLYNFGSMDTSLYDKFVKLFQGEYDLSEVIKSGTFIVNSQILLARERALNNSRTEKLSDGTLAAITEGPELVNLTHEALHQKYPHAQVTLVLGVKFGQTSKEDELSYSIRSFDVSVNAQKLGKKVRGDGGQNTAGGRIHIDLPAPF